MSRLNLTAKDGAEARILEYLELTASEALAAKINGGKRTLAGAMAYCKGQAKKMLEGGNCVCVDEATVYGWAVHFFEDGETDERSGREMKGTDGARKTLSTHSNAARTVPSTAQNTAGADEEPETTSGIFDGVDVFGGAK